jgi:hypothetical protein
MGVSGAVFFCELCTFDTEFEPLVIDGPWIRVDLEKVFPNSVLVENGETFITFATTFIVTERLSVSKSYLNVATGGIGYEFKDVTANGTESLQFTNNTFVGPGEYISGLTVNDNESFFRSNSGLVDTIPTSGWYITANVNATIINTIDVPELVVGLTVLADIVQKFDHIPEPNRLTYTGDKPRLFQISGSFSLSTSANTQIVNLLLAVNGVILPNIKFSATTTGSAGARAENLAVSAVLQLNTDDYVQAYVSNSTSTDDITVLDAFLFLVAQN